MNRINCYHEIKEKVCVNCRSIIMISWFEEFKFPFEIRAIFFQNLMNIIPGNAKKGDRTLCSKEHPLICEKCFFNSSIEILNNLAKNKLGNSTIRLMFESEPILVTQSEAR
jgi:hypothetical protein